MTKTYHYARIHARSEKHLTDRLNEIVGMGNWMKTKRMIDTYGSGGFHIGGQQDAPIFDQVYDHSDGYPVAIYSTQAYRGVIFIDGERAALAKTFLPTVETMVAGDMVAVRSFHEIEIGRHGRYWALGPTGLPWEDKAEAKALYAKAKANLYGLA